MKGSLLFLVFVVAAHAADAQKVAVAFTKMNVLYRGVDNPITVVAANVPQKNIFLTTDNGQFFADYDGLQRWRVEKLGAAEVKISERTVKGERYLGKTAFRVKDIPPAIAKLGGLSEGTMEAARLRIQIGPTAPIECCGFDAKAKIISFTFILIKDSIVVAETHHYKPDLGCRFSDERATQEAISGIRRGDVVWIKDIQAVGPTRGRKFHLNDICILAN